MSNCIFVICSPIKAWHWLSRCPRWSCFHLTTRPQIRNYTAKSRTSSAQLSSTTRPCHWKETLPPATFCTPQKKKIQTSSFSDATEGVVFAVGTEKKKTSVPRTRSRISGIEPAAHFSVDLTRSFKERGDGGVILVAFSLSHHPLNKT